MKEDFLHYLWRVRRFDVRNLQTTDGDRVEILQTGALNTHSGPDFQNVQLRIGDVLWAGCVEMHVKASDWLAHSHQKDAAYNNVILHVVYDADLPADAISQKFPCLELKKYIPEGVYQQYWRLLHSEDWIPCRNLFPAVSSIVKSSWIDRLTAERLEARTAEIDAALDQNRGNWEETFYQFLARRFGARLNAQPFDALARATPNRILSKHRDHLFQLEALLFGQSGLLEHDFEDDYPQSLKKEYAFLRSHYQLAPMEPVAWKFARLRPSSFPTVRIAQLAALAHQSIHLFSKLLEANSVEEAEKLLAVQLKSYWLTHYVFDKLSLPRAKSLGKSAIHILIINTVAPFLFTYGKHLGNDSFKEKALRWLEALPPEENYIIEGWEKLGERPKSAYETQGLIQLKTLYCEKKRCLECAVGNAILK